MYFVNDATGQVYKDTSNIFGNVHANVYTDINGRYYYKDRFGTKHAAHFTQDCSFRAMSNVGLSYWSAPITRYLYDLQSFAYAIPNGINTLKVELSAMTDSNLTGSYNEDISAIMFKYVPNAVVNGDYTDVNGTFLYEKVLLSNSGTTQYTFNLSNVAQNTSGTYAGNALYNKFKATYPNGMNKPYDAEDPHTYNPPAWVPDGKFYPITYLVVTNRQVNDFVFGSDPYFMSQVNPSSVKLSVTF
jgi:hypothetical protein